MEKMFGKWFGFAMIPLLCFGVGKPPLALASYEDEVGGVTAREVWKAAYQVLRDYGGIHKSDPDKMILESKWNQDTVKRSRGMFRRYLNQSVNRRYRIRVEIQPGGQAVSLKIKGTFQEKTSRTEANLPWNSFKPDASDMRVEREVFFKILTQIENQKKQTPASSDSTPAPDPSAPIS